MMNEEMTRLLTIVENEKTDSNINSILLSGEKANPELVTSLQNYQKYAKIEFANPFRHVQRRLSLTAETLVTTKADKFLVNVGLIS